MAPCPGTCLRTFKALTMGKPMIMGRKTFSLPGIARPPPYRGPGANGGFDGAEIARSVEEALALGGEGDVHRRRRDIRRVHGAPTNRADRNHAEFDGDTFMKPPGPDGPYAGGRIAAGIPACSRHWSARQDFDHRETLPESLRGAIIDWAA